MHQRWITTGWCVGAAHLGDMFASLANRVGTQITIRDFLVSNGRAYKIARRDADDSRPGKDVTRKAESGRGHMTGSLAGMKREDNTVAR
jgi:hypothetical protein